MGALIPYEVITSLVLAAELSITDSKKLSLRELIEVARENSNGIWPVEVRDAIWGLLGNQDQPRPLSESTNSKRASEEREFTMKMIRAMLDIQDQTTLRSRLVEFGADVPDSPGRQQWGLKKQELICFLKWMGNGNGKTFSRAATAALKDHFGVE